MELWDVLSLGNPGEDFIPDPASSESLPHKQLLLPRVYNVHI